MFKLFRKEIGECWLKMHSQARAFLQPTRANIHQCHLNNPILPVQD